MIGNKIIIYNTVIDIGYYILQILILFTIPYFFPSTGAMFTSYLFHINCCSYIFQIKLLPVRKVICVKLNEVRLSKHTAIFYELLLLRNTFVRKNKIVSIRSSFITALHSDLMIRSAENNHSTLT